MSSFRADRSGRGSSGEPAVSSTRGARGRPASSCSAALTRSCTPGLIDDVCQTLRVPVAFLCADGTPVFFPTSPNTSFPTPALARDFDDARRRWIAAWKPDLLIVVDRWDHYPATLDAKLRGLLGELGRYARHVILPGQIPVLRIGETVNLRDYVTWRLRSSSNPASHRPRFARADPAGVADDHRRPRA